MSMKTPRDGSRWRLVTQALYRARWAILSVAAVNPMGVIVGALMVHSGSEFALSYGDKLVVGGPETGCRPLFLIARGIGSLLPQKILR